MDIQLDKMDILILEQTIFITTQNNKSVCIMLHAMKKNSGTARSSLRQAMHPVIGGTIAGVMKRVYSICMHARFRKERR
jgi:hypothetical protein